MNKLITILLTIYLASIIKAGAASSPTPTISTPPTQSLTPSPTPESSSDSANIIRDKVKEKVELLAKQPKAIIGKILDLPDSIIEIETVTGEIRQAKTDSATVFVNNENGSAKNIQFKDLAIGDWIIAMGFSGDNSIFSAARVVTTPESPIIKRHAFLAIVQNIKKDYLTVKQANKDDLWTVQISKKTKFLERSNSLINDSDLNKIAEGSKIIIGGEPIEGKDNTLSAHIILLLSDQKPTGIKISPTNTPKMPTPTKTNTYNP